ALTFTLSPREPRFATFSSRITSISLTSSCFIQPARQALFAPGYPASYPQKPEPTTASSDSDQTDPVQRKTQSAPARPTAYDQQLREPEPEPPQKVESLQPMPAAPG